MVPPLHRLELDFGFGVGHKADVPSQVEPNAHSVSSAHSKSCNFPISLHSLLQHFPSLGLKANVSF